MIIYNITLKTSPQVSNDVKQRKLPVVKWKVGLLVWKYMALCMYCRSITYIEDQGATLSKNCCILHKC